MVRIHCQHWSACDANRDGGCCALGWYAGTPSIGVCRGCMNYQGEPESGNVRVNHRETPPPQPSDINRFHLLWGELHRRPYEAGDLSKEWEWLKEFEKRLPCGQCTRNWQAWITDHPPNLTSREAYFAWTAAAHNAVNKTIGKPPWSVADARRRWV